MRLLICDERRSVRDRMAKGLAAVAGVAAIDSVSSGDELMNCYDRDPADAVLIGTQRALMHGVESVRRLLTLYPAAGVIVFGSSDDAGSISAAVSYGARGFLRWDAAATEIAALLAYVTTDSLLNTRRQEIRADNPLTGRELEVLGGMSRGLSNAEIGRELFLSADTIKTHARRLYRKLDAVDRAHAVAIGLRSGLIR
ncbi:MAG: response regulator transcription factor [Nakamurella sp.]